MAHMQNSSFFLFVDFEKPGKIAGWFLRNILLEGKSKLTEEKKHMHIVQKLLNVDTLLNCYNSTSKSLDF